MVLTSPRPGPIILNCTRIKSSQYLFYIPNEKKNAMFKSIFHFDRLFTKLKGLAMIFVGQKTPFIIFRNKEIYYIFQNK